MSPTRIATNLVSVVVLSVLAGSVHMQEPRDERWRQAAPGYTLEFPQDHASHPEYRIEWWYYTGNLDASDGRRFGYQVTFFRVGIDPQPTNPSRWAVRDLHMAHLAITDMRSGRHLVAERLNRVGVGWAGARADVFSVWNEDWTAGLDGTAHVLDAKSDRGQFGVELRLDPGRLPVLHGDEGFSQKGAEKGNASHYYSMTRMLTNGKVFIDGAAIDVTGLSWMDHEFGTTFLEPMQRGWDWFSLQLDDGTDVMVYVLRRQDASEDPQSGGTVVNLEGGQTILRSGDYRLVPGRTWTSPTSGAQYPVEWQVRIPSAELELAVRATIDQQELHTDQSTGVTYWEGAVDVVGTRAGQPVVGRGYLEMTGYAGQPMSDVLR